MTSHELTQSLSPATSRPMGEAQAREQGSGRRAVRAAGMLIAASLMCSACISVNAPDKPIVIELNINIKQEIVYRLAADAANTIDKNPEIF